MKPTAPSTALSTALPSVLLSLILAACGGGGGSNTANNDTPNNQVSQGMITGFGSVIVNGVHFDLAGEVEFDGESRVESDLAVGQFVRITGALDNNGKSGRAVKLVGESQLLGPITSIDLEAGILVALGQTIVLSTDTFYTDDLSPADLQVGSIIRLSGYRNADGQLVATRIDLKESLDNSRFQLTGDIENLDTSAKTFVLNGTLVNYSEATLSALRGAVLENGLKIRVIGRVEGNTFFALGNLHPSHLGFKHRDDLDRDWEIKLSGLITDLIPNESFYIAGTRVIINSATEFDDGLVSDLENGLLVKVEGRLDAEQNLVADEIELNYRARISTKGLLSAVDLTSNSFTVNGISFEADEDTSFNDRSRAKVRFFDLADLTTGDTLHVRAYQIPATDSAAARNIATRVERHNPHAFGDGDWKLEVEGIIEAADFNSITVEGQVIQVSSLTRIDGYSDFNAFLAAAVGLQVEVRALTQNGVAVALHIEIDEHDEEDDGDDEEDDNQSSSSSSAASSTGSI